MARVNELEYEWYKAYAEWVEQKLEVGEYPTSFTEWLRSQGNKIC